MTPLQSPDRHHLNAASGWVELGNAVEASAELTKIDPALQEHPDVLELRWQVSAAGHDWEKALAIGERLLQLAPDREISWLHRAYALRRAPGGGLEKAFSALRPAYDQFPNVPVISYNLACYTAQLGRLEEGWDWLQKASKAGDSHTIQKMALADSDLQPLWEKIQQM